MSTGSSADSTRAHGIGFGEAARVWTEVAVNSFGGPAGQIAVMHRILVERNRWFSEQRFLHALNYAMLLPGPEAQQLATYFGWLLHGVRGGLVAGGLFVLPGFLAILVLSVLYAGFGDVPAVEAIFYGIKPAVMAVVTAAVVRIGSRSLKNGVMVGIAVAAFVSIFFLAVPFPVLILIAGILGYAGDRVLPRVFVVRTRHGVGGKHVDEPSPLVSDEVVDRIRPSTARAVKTSAVGLVLWFAPIAVLAAWRGPDNIYVREGLFFSSAAVVTFGGAYSVLAYIAQQAVQTYGWLAPGEMLDGLGMAETTPGPLIQVVQFVGFMGAYRAAGGLDPMMAGFAGAVITTWVTFVPCFLWIFLGAPYIEYLRGNTRLTAALSAITAAVVGVVLNLAVWFSLHTLFDDVREVRRFGVRLYQPEWVTIDAAAAALALAAFYLIFRRGWNMLTTLAVSALAGAAIYLA